MRAHRHRLPGLKVVDGGSGLVSAPAMSAHQAIPASSSMLLMFNSSPCNRVSRFEPQGQEANSVSVTNSTPQPLQRALPSTCLISSVAPSSAVPCATVSKQNTIASAITPDNFPISSVTRRTRRPFAASPTMATMFLLMPSSCMAIPSADPGQLLANQHVDDSPPSEHGPHSDAARLPMIDAPNDRRARTERMRSHRRQRCVGLLRRRDHHDLAFIGEIERIKPQDLAECLD